MSANRYLALYAASQDLAGNVEPEVVRRTFTIATVPDTTITSGPPSGVSFILPRFTFTASAPGSSFECTVDNRSFARCDSPLTRYDLSLRQHTLSVRAISPDGLVDPTPAIRRFSLGERTVRGRCSFRFPFARSRLPVLLCQAASAVCPIGSVCTRVGEVNISASDVRTRYAALVGWPRSEQTGSIEDVGVGGYFARCNQVPSY